MTYAVSQALQQAVYATLTAHQPLTDQVGGAIYDAIPAGALPSLYVSLGPEEVRDASDATGAAAIHEFVVSVVTTGAGFAAAKAAAGAVSEALSGAAPALATGCTAGIAFLKAKAARTADADQRRIDLTFRARVDG
ncbi:MAG: DUF3168 domain-containing protein [Shimia sp.]